jgi:hypothetical protein
MKLLSNSVASLQLSFFDAFYYLLAKRYCVKLSLEGREKLLHL